VSKVSHASSQAEFTAQAAEDFVVKSRPVLGDLLFAAAALVVAATLCVYGFIKILPLAMTYKDAAPASTASPTPP
jgi:hypothetical protein